MSSLCEHLFLYFLANPERCILLSTPEMYVVVHYSIHCIYQFLLIMRDFSYGYWPLEILLCKILAPVSCSVCVYVCVLSFLLSTNTLNIEKYTYSFTWGTGPLLFVFCKYYFFFHYVPWFYYFKVMFWRTKFLIL